jgi:hypothetical protein
VRAILQDGGCGRPLDRAGWNGVWVKNWHGRAFWTDINTPIALPPAQARLFESIEHSTGNRKGGCWDIFAGRGGETLFIEWKQRSIDHIRPAQASWLEHALENGVPLSSFLISEYVIDRGPA